MGRFAQVGIALGVLGVILALMGLFPQLTGVTATLGIGLVQVLMVLTGWALLLGGAVIYVKFTFYLGHPPTLGQQVGLRLAMTGLLFASLMGFADLFGFGSHFRADASEIVFGNLQAIGFIASFAVSSLGIVIYSLMGRLDDDAPPNA